MADMHDTTSLSSALSAGRGYATTLPQRTALSVRHGLKRRTSLAGVWVKARPPHATSHGPRVIKETRYATCNGPATAPHTQPSTP